MKKILLAFLLFSISAFAQEKPSPNNPPEKYPEYFKEELDKTNKFGESNFFEEFIQMMIYLIGIIAFMVFFMWIFKRLLSVKIQQSNKTCEIKIIESRAISQKTTLHIIEIYDREYAIAESLNGVTRLGELSSDQKSHETPSSFDSRLTP